MAQWSFPQLYDVNPPLGNANGNANAPAGAALPSFMQPQPPGDWAGAAAPAKPTAAASNGDAEPQPVSKSPKSGGMTAWLDKLGPTKSKWLMGAFAVLVVLLLWYSWRKTTSAPRRLDAPAAPKATVRQNPVSHPPSPSSAPTAAASLSAARELPATTAPLPPSPTPAEPGEGEAGGDRRYRRADTVIEEGGNEYGAPALPSEGRVTSRLPAAAVAAAAARQAAPSNATAAALLERDAAQAQLYTLLHHQQDRVQDQFNRQASKIKSLVRNLHDQADRIHRLQNEVGELARKVGGSAGSSAAPTLYGSLAAESFDAPSNGSDSGGGGGGDGQSPPSARRRTS